MHTYIMSFHDSNFFFFLPAENLDFSILHVCLNWPALHLYHCSVRKERDEILGTYLDQVSVAHVLNDCCLAIQLNMVKFDWLLMDVASFPDPFLRTRTSLYV